MSALLASREQIAEILQDCGIRTVAHFVDEGMPKAARGKYPIARCVDWYVERKVAQARAERGLNDLDVARQRKTNAEARLAELELAKAEESVVPVATFEEVLTERLETVAGALKAIHRYQPDVKAATTDEDADALLDRMRDEMLAELHGLSDSIEEVPR